MNVITLFRASGQWHARHSGPAARPLVDLFDTDTLPTPYMASCPAERVLLAIQALNTGWHVELAEDFTGLSEIASRAADRIIARRSHDA